MIDYLCWKSLIVVKLFWITALFIQATISLGSQCCWFWYRGFFLNKKLIYTHISPYRVMCVNRTCHCWGLYQSGCLQLMEILEISLSLYGPPGNFCVKCRWSTLLFFSQDKTGYGIAYVRNWSPFFMFATAPCCAYQVFVL